MRFAAIADVHGNYLALEAVIADIRAQGIDEIVNLGDMASGPLDARRTMDALLALDAARVIAVERDNRAIAALHEIAAHYPGRLDIVAADALTFDPRPHLPDGPVRIVANLPYNIATALLVSWLSVEPWPPWSRRPRSS